MPRTILDQQLAELRTAVTDLGARVVDALSGALAALDQQDHALALEVVVGDEAIDQGCAAVEQLSLRVVTLQQPLVGDLRQAMAALMIAEQLERMGDHAQGIAQLVTRLPQAPEPPFLAAFAELGRLVRRQVDETLAAYRTTDVAAARRVWGRDADVDAQYAALTQRLMGALEATQGVATRDTYLLWMAHNLERIADRATNICEQVVFIATGARVMVGPPPASREQ